MYNYERTYPSTEFPFFKIVLFQVKFRNQLEASGTLDQYFADLKNIDHKCKN